VRTNTSPLFDVPHGFTTREGGVSTGPYKSLNLGLNTGDESKKVLENLALAARAAGFAPGALALVKQVHGNRVLRAGPMAQSELVAPPQLEADGIWSEREGVAVAVTVADCAPVLLLDVQTRRVGAVHAGWKGAMSRIPERAIIAWRAHGSRPKDVRAAIGPCIRPCCYEVSDELAQSFIAEFGDGVAVKKGARFHLDLPFAVKSSLVAAGVPEAQIDMNFACTACTPDLYFSHRRDKGETGRQMGFIACGR
jgi:YfiH family protein